MCEYDTIKRYTSSKKDAEPQMRIDANMNKRFGIIAESSKIIPASPNSIKLMGENEIDKEGVKIVSPTAVYRWSKYGPLGDQHSQFPSQH